VQGFIWCLIGSGFSIFLAAVRNPRYIHEQIGADSFTRLSLERSNGNFGNPNYLACLMSLLIILSLAQLNATLNKFVKLGLLALTGCFCYVLFLAQSRGASLGLAGALLCFWILQKGKVRNLLIVTAMAGFAFYAAPESYWERIASVGHYQDDRSATDRLKLWSIGLDLISNNPLLGIGPDNFESRAFNSPHDAYVQVASEMGIPALLVYLALLATAFRALWRAQLACRTLERASQPIVAISVGLTGALIIVVIQGCTTGLAHREFVYILITLSYCLQNIAEEDAGRVSVSDSEVADEVAEPANAGTGS
jgi:O-antigen ligase